MLVSLRIHLIAPFRASITRTYLLLGMRPRCCLVEVWVGSGYSVGKMGIEEEEEKKGEGKSKSFGR